MSRIVSSEASPLSARSVMNVWRLSCHRPVTPASFLIAAQTVLKLVPGRAGSVGCGFPKGSTYHSGRVSPNLFRYHLECATSAARTSALRGIVLPSPASVLDSPAITTALWSGARA
jgi:hypothetical protein